jgi:hypothetical protein
MRSRHRQRRSAHGTYTLPAGGKLSADFHTYAVEWSASAIKFHVADNLGGTFPEAPSSSTTLPETMKVDWRRVYRPIDAG